MPIHPYGVSNDINDQKSMGTTHTPLHFLETACNNRGCNWRGPLNKTPEHDLNCPYELSECYICKLKLARGFPNICLVKLIERVEKLERLVESTEKEKETQEVIKRDRKIAKLNNRLQHLEVLLNAAGYENVSEEEDDPMPPNSPISTPLGSPRFTVVGSRSRSRPTIDNDNNVASDMDTVD